MRTTQTILRNMKALLIARRYDDLEQYDKAIQAAIGKSISRYEYAGITQAFDAFVDARANQVILNINKLIGD